MRLTEPGLYVARDGRVAVSYLPWPDSDMLCFCIRTKDSNHLEYLYADSQLTAGEWQRIDLDAVQWPELPPKPCLCYTDVLDAPGSPMWRIVRESNACNLRSIHHPGNDPEAVAMIEAARKEAGDA